MTLDLTDTERRAYGGLPARSLIVGPGGETSSAIVRAFENAGIRVELIDTSGLDFTDAESMTQLEQRLHRLLDQANDALGCLVTISSSMDPRPFLSIEEGEWQTAFRRDLTSAFVASHESLPRMTGDSGRIIYVSGILGRTGSRLRVTETAVKAGLLGLAHTLALEVADRNITVNVVSGPANDTAQLVEAADTDAIARACAFVASRDAAFLTGQEVRVTGGLPLW
jgi:3-oxoacyl-[acyl-carrier protein] reductase